MADPVSQLGCIKVVDSDLPDTIQDLSTLTITMNSQGMATLSISILGKEGLDGGFDHLGDVEFDGFEVSDSQKFYGYIDSINPQPDNGSEYIDYRVIAKGIIC